MSRFFLVAFLYLSATALFGQSGTPQFSDVTVHDPSVVRVDGTFYIFGSHMAAARSDDLMNWTQFSANPNNTSLFDNPWSELSEAVAWTSTEDDNAAFWAPDAIQLPDGRFYFYYCTGILSGPRGYLGLAVADDIEGPYEDLGLIRRSGESGFDARVHPNAVDPHTFFDHEGNLWMVYGSYSGGIFILRMDPQTGMPLTGRGAPDQGWGTRLIGGNHVRIEAPYILYSPESGYYYLFLSYGGLGAGEGYQMRVMRSENPDGPYFDSEGNDMREVAGASGTFFHDPSIEPYGVKLMGDHRFLHEDGEPENASTGYVSPGHNSAYYDEETGRYYLIFHTRFVGAGQFHRVRVHQMYLNEDDWFVVAPHRYAGETPGTFADSQVPGLYKIINHGKEISDQVNESVTVRLASDGSIRTASSGRPETLGSWEFSGERTIRVTFDGIEYRGVFNTQWDDDNAMWVHAFTTLSDTGVAVWGSRVAEPGNAAPSADPLELWRQSHFGTSRSEGPAADDADPNGSGLPNLMEYALGRDPLAPGAPAPYSVGMDGSESRLSLTFHRIADPALTYSVEAADAPTGPWTPIWSSTGTENEEGTVSVTDPEPTNTRAMRFLRLSVSR